MLVPSGNSIFFLERGVHADHYKKNSMPHVATFRNKQHNATLKAHQSRGWDSMGSDEKFSQISRT